MTTDTPFKSIVDFQSFPKIGRLNRDCVITEKIDGSNGQIHIFP